MITFNELRRLYSSNSIERLPEISHVTVLCLQAKMKFKAIMKALSSWYGIGEQRDKLRFTTIDVPVHEYEVGVARIVDIKHNFVVIIKHGNKYESFIHVDGIQEERERETNRSHPVFKIECLTDILMYNADYREIENISEEPVKETIINGWR